MLRKFPPSLTRKMMKMKSARHSDIAVLTMHLSIISMEIGTIMMLTTTRLMKRCKKTNRITRSRLSLSKRKGKKTLKRRSVRAHLIPPHKAHTEGMKTLPPVRAKLRSELEALLGTRQNCSDKKPTG